MKSAFLLAPHGIEISETAAPRGSQVVLSGLSNASASFVPLRGVRTVVVDRALQFAGTGR